MARLWVTTPDTKFSTDVEGTFLRIGRHDENDVVVDEPEVSRVHARVENESGVWRITDLGSTNGTTVDGVALKPWEPRALDSGNTIVVGSARIEFLLDPDDADHAGMTTVRRTPKRNVMLTPAESAVLELLFMHYDEGDRAPRLATTPEIAERRFTGTDAVKLLLRSMYRKFDLEDSGRRSREELALRAQDWSVTRRRY